MFRSEGLASEPPPRKGGESNIIVTLFEKEFSASSNDPRLLTCLPGTRDSSCVRPFSSDTLFGCMFFEGSLIGVALVFSDSKIQPHIWGVAFDTPASYFLELASFWWQSEQSSAKIPVHGFGSPDESTWWIFVFTAYVSPKMSVQSISPHFQRGEVLSEHFGKAILVN